MNRNVLGSALTVAGLSLVASAQTSLQIVTGTTVGDQSGKSTTVVGDVNRDGFADIAIGAPYTDVGGTSSGSVRIVNGHTGATLYLYNGLAAGDRLGESVGRVGDLDRDGYADFAAGAPLNDQNGVNAGLCRVWSGRTGAVLYTWYGDDASDWFGAAVDGAGDVNNDGWPDVIVGAPYGSGTNTANVGEARIFSGRDGSVIRTHNAPAGVALLGASVSGAGDINHDGFADVVIGAPQSGYSYIDAGRCWVFSGANGATLHTYDGASHGEYFATSVDGGHDVNNDGWTDVIIGAPFADFNGGNSGSVYVYSGKTWALLYHFKGLASYDELGRTCALVGDVDGDGWADVAGGAKMNDHSLANTGMCRVWSGRTGAPLFSVYGNALEEQLGYCVSGGGDVDGDGLDDVVVGWPTFDVNASNADVGRVRAWSAVPLPVTGYCTAQTNSAGCAAVLTTTGTPSVSSGAAFTLRAAQVTNNRAGLFFYGRHGQAVPYQNGYLCVDSPVVRTWAVNSGGSAAANDCSGTLTFNLTSWLQQNMDPSLSAGDTLFGQFWYRDPVSTSNIAFSSAVYFTLLP